MCVCARSQPSCGQVVFLVHSWCWVAQYGGKGVLGSVCRYSSLACFRDSTGSLVGLDVCKAEEEDRSSGLSEVADHSDILAYLCGNKTTSHEQWTVSRSVL